MEKNEKNVRDERVAKFISKHGIKNMALMYLIWFGYMHELSEDTIKLYGIKEYSPIIAESKYMAIMLGLSYIDEIETFEDVRRQIAESAVLETLNRQAEYFESVNQKIDMLNDKIDALSYEEDNESSTDIDINKMEQNLETLAERITISISNIESGMNENISEVNETLVQCVDSILELSECNLSLLKSAYDNQELLKSISESSMQRELSDLSQKLDTIKGFLVSNNSSRKSILSYITGKQKQQDRLTVKANVTENTVDFHETEKETQSENIEVAEEEEKKKAGVKKYNEIVTRMNDKDNEVTVVDFLNLIRTGVFDKKQAEIITKAIQQRLTIIEITEIAKPEQSAEVMEEILSFLLATREGTQRKEARQEKRGGTSTKIIDKRKTQREQKTVQISDNTESNDEEDEDSF